MQAFIANVLDPELQQFEAGLQARNNGLATEIGEYDGPSSRMIEVWDSQDSTLDPSRFYMRFELRPAELTSSGLLIETYECVEVSWSAVPALTGDTGRLHAGDIHQVVDAHFSVAMMMWTG